MNTRRFKCLDTNFDEHRITFTYKKKTSRCFSWEKQFLIYTWPGSSNSLMIRATFNSIYSSGSGRYIHSASIPDSWFNEFSHTKIEREISARKACTMNNKTSLFQSSSLPVLSNDFGLAIHSKITKKPTFQQWRKTASYLPMMFNENLWLSHPHTDDQHLFTYKAPNSFPWESDRNFRSPYLHSLWFPPSLSSGLHSGTVTKSPIFVFVGWIHIYYWNVEMYAFISFRFESEITRKWMSDSSLFALWFVKQLLEMNKYMQNQSPQPYLIVLW